MRASTGRRRSGWPGAGAFHFSKIGSWIRPPLYVLFLAALIKVFGPVALAPIRVAQALLGTATVGIVMLWARRLAPYQRARPVALAVGWTLALSYSLATYSFLLLSETLFLFWLCAALLALTVWRQGGRRRWLVAGGVLLGCAALTRAMLAGALPLIALWVAWQARPPRQPLGVRLRRALLAAGALTVVVSAVILPWSVYNTRFFAARSLLLIDTTGGYNAMFSMRPPGVDEDDIYAALIAVPDHSARQALAYRTGWQWFWADPARQLGQRGAELADLVLPSINGAEHLAKGYTAGFAPAPHLLGLLLDDTVYVIVLPLALIGVLRGLGQRGAGLGVIWLGYNIAVAALFFAISRFRLPLLPVLVVFAALAVADRRRPWTTRGRQRLTLGAAAALLVFLLGGLLWWPGSANQRRALLADVSLGLQARAAAADCAAASAALGRGDQAAAAALLAQGEARKPLSCFALVRARLLAQSGDLPAALALLKNAAASGELTLNAARVLMLEGDLQRSSGDLDTARGLFASRAVDTNNDQAWAWDNLQPPAATVIEPGKGLDLGLIRGWGPREKSDERQPFASGYRWTEAHSELQFPAAGTGRPQILQLRLNGARPAGERLAQVRVWAGGQLAGEFQALSSWQTVRIPLPPTPRGQPVVVALETNIFVPSPLDAPKLPLRLRGVQVDRAALTTP